MRKKHLETLAAVFATPVRANIEWKEAEAMLNALGASLTEGNGSRVRVLLNGRRAVFHRPHPEKEMDKGAVKSLQVFLVNAGVTP